MTPVVSIIMGSTSDLPVMGKAAKLLDEMEIPFEMHALSAHRTPAEVEAFAKGAKGRGIKVIIAAAGMAAHLCGVIASMTTVPVIGVPINSTLGIASSTTPVRIWSPSLTCRSTTISAPVAVIESRCADSQMTSIGSPQIVA